MKTQIYVFLLLVFDLWIAINLEFRLPRISKYGMLYTKKKKRCELEGGCHRFDCLDGVCVCSSRGGSNDLGGSRPSKQTSILPQIRSFFFVLFFASHC